MCTFMVSGRSGCPRARGVPLNELVAVPVDVGRSTAMACDYTGQVLTAAGWQVVELNPGHVAMQRRVNGQRGVKSDPSTGPRPRICCWPAVAVRSSSPTSRWSS